MTSYDLAKFLLTFPDEIIGVLVGPNVVQPIGAVAFAEEAGDTGRIVCIILPDIEATALHPSAPPEGETLQ